MARSDGRAGCAGEGQSAALLRRWRIHDTSQCWAAAAQLCSRNLWRKPHCGSPAASHRSPSRSAVAQVCHCQDGHRAAAVQPDRSAAPSSSRLGQPFHSRAPALSALLTSAMRGSARLHCRLHPIVGRKNPSRPVEHVQSRARPRSIVWVTEQQQLGRDQGAGRGASASCTGVAADREDQPGSEGAAAVARARWAPAQPAII